MITLHCASGRRQAGVFAATCLLIFAFPPRLATAGPSFPIVAASSSANLQFLVTLKIEAEPVKANVERIKRITLRVLEKEPLINAKDGIAGPLNFWSQNFGRTVSLEGKDVRHNGLPLALIANDGRYLVVVFVDPAMSQHAEALRVYELENESYHFTRSILLGEILTPSEIDPLYTERSPRLPPHASATDASPQWFAGGSFSFSDDNRELIHKTRWGNTVRIKLTN